VKEINATTQITQTKCNKDIKINGHNVVALIDTRSDLCLMRADQYSEIGSPALERKETQFRGVGLNENVALGEFCAELMSTDSYPVIIRVVANNVINHKFFIGIDFLNTVELCIKNGNVLINPVNNTIVEDHAI